MLTHHALKVSRWKYEQTMTEFMGKLVENELTPQDRELIKKNDANIKRENILKCLKGMGVMSATVYGVYKVMQNFDKLGSAVREFAGVYDYTADKIVMLGAVAVGFVGFAYGIYLMPSGFDNHDGTNYKRSIYMKYRTAREFMAKQASNQNQI
jgi:hypothetical protein